MEIALEHVAASDLLEDLHKDPRMMVRSEEPLNIETALDALEDAITPLPLFFVRNNDTIPHIAPEEWSLRIDGLVERPLTLSYAELCQLPATRYVAVLECSGNSRARFATDGRVAEGVQWCNGAVGNAEWVGVPTRLVLERAGVRPDALQAECIGGDEDRTTRGVEVAKLLDDAMLAYAMNGELLPPLHGGPVRLIVPGWGGINSIKWINGLHLISHESDSKYNQQKYVMVDEHGETTGKIRHTFVKSVFANIGPGACLTGGLNVLRGFAWSPNGMIGRVEVSVDAGTTWADACLLADLGPHSWRQWQWQWDASPGDHLLMVRATDEAGETQPLTVPFNLHGYGMNAIEQVPVIVT